MEVGAIDDFTAKYTFDLAAVFSPNAKFAKLNCSLNMLDFQYYCESS